MPKSKFNISAILRLKDGKTNVFYIGIIVVIAAMLGAIIFFISGEQAEITNSIFKKRKAEVNMEEQIRKKTPELPSGIAMVVPEGAGDLPEGFADIPLNSKKEMVRSYTLTYPGDNQKQRVVNFISSQSVAENFKFYKSWSAQNNWNILYELEKADESILNIKNGKTILVVTIAPDSDNSSLSKINISE